MLPALKNHLSAQWQINSLRSRSPEQRVISSARLRFKPLANDSNMWWIGPVVILLLRILYSEAISERAGRRGDALVFRMALGARILFAVGLLALLVTFALSIGHEEKWVYVLGGLLLAALCFACPVTIILAEDAIYRSVWWRRRLRIPWESVIGIEREPSGESQVYSKHGEKITFSRYHVDPGKFEREVLRRGRIGATTDGSALPSLDH
jgi:hypothetical protein